MKNLGRYVKHAAFKFFSEEDIRKLSEKSVAIVGVGSVGGKIAELLVRGGVGNVILIDRNYVELENLTTHALFDENDVGMPKAVAAKEKLNTINSEVKVTAHPSYVNKDTISHLMGNVDLVIDGLDNMQARYLLNDYCLKNKIPWIHVALAGSMGVIFNIIPSDNTPCFQCLYPKEMVGDALESYESEGTLNAFVDTIAGIAALEAFRILLNKDYSKELIYIEFWKHELQKIGVEKDANCPACNSNYEHLGKDVVTVEMCGNNKYHIMPDEKQDFDTVVSYLSTKGGKLKYNEYILHYESEEGATISMFRDGRVIVKNASSKEGALELFKKYISSASHSIQHPEEHNVNNDSLSFEDVIPRFSDEHKDFDSNMSKEEKEGSGDELFRNNVNDGGDEQDYVVSEEKEKEEEDDDDSLFFPNPFQ